MIVAIGIAAGLVLGWIAIVGLWILRVASPHVVLLRDAATIETDRQS